MTHNKIRQFQIFKEGVTTLGAVWIVSIEGQVFDQQEKINKYLALGYEVTNIQKTNNQ